MSTILSDVSPLELGRRLMQVRELAGMKQAELARRVTWSPAVLSRIESGERPLSADELKSVTDAIGTADALQLSDVLGRDWQIIPRPPLDHPDQDLLWDAEQTCRRLNALRTDPHIRPAFERRFAEYVEDLRHTCNLLLRRDHQIAVVGPIGIGKSTLICKAANLEVPTADGRAPVPVLEVGGGGITVCEVHIRTGREHGIVIDPCTDNEIRAHVTDFAEHILKSRTTSESDELGVNPDETLGISREIERAIRNLASLKVKREKGRDGKTVRRDEAKELAHTISNVREYVVEVLARMELHRRDRRDLRYDSAYGKSPLAWLHYIFEQINNGSHPEFSLPKRIELVVPDPLLGTNDLSIRFVDTKGIDRTAARADLERHLEEPHTLALLCSGFNDAPSSAAHLLLERAKQVGVGNLETNVALVVLPRPTEALAMKDEDRTRVQTAQEGYELKKEQVALALEPLGMQGLAVSFFNAFGDDPAELRSFLLERLDKIRERFRSQIQETTRNAATSLENHEKEQVQEVLRAAAGMMRTWVSKSSTVPPLAGSVQESLMAQMRTAYASTIRATIRREGEWHNLDYGHHLGFGSRRLAVIALEPLVKGFTALTEVMEVNPDYQEASNLIQQCRRVLDVAFEELLRKAQIMGLTLFKEALKLDPSLWLNCEQEWGQGSGYKGRVMNWNSEWFGAQPRRELEEELRGMVTREWEQVLARLSSLLDSDAPASAAA